MKLNYIILSVCMAALVCCSNADPENGGTGGETPEGPQRQEGFVYTDGGRLYGPDGQELALWGVNLQPCISWEYHDRLQRRGVQETAEALKKVADNNLDEVARLGVNIVRCHLTPADFTDADGNLVDSPYLETLDYMVAGAAERGIYVTLAFINHMNNAYFPESVFNNVTREDWIMDPDVVSKSGTYVGDLLDRTNSYTGRKYSEEPAIAFWELVNEPSLYDWSSVQSHENAFKAYTGWAEAKGIEANSGNYLIYREETLKNYIDGMYSLIRDHGACQPVIWSHNWPRYRGDSTLDIFDAALASSADGMAFCCYPGQDLVSQDYWANPKNLTGEDYAGWFNNYFTDINGYGWMKQSAYGDRVKTVYEFETFFNQSAYLYPAMALYFRALGVSAATMWTYTMQEYAQWHSGSHFLSLTCTPSKAASFMVAQAIFENIPAGRSYDQLFNEQLGTGYAISRDRDLSIWSDEEQLIYSGDITKWAPLPIYGTVRKIAGVGSSSLVSYDGTGIYFIEDTGDELRITIEPDHTWLGEPWNSLQSGQVSRLDYGTPHSMSIDLDAWPEGTYALYRIEEGVRQKVSDIASLEGMTVSPGEYAIVKL